jgi:hypothetical protein
MENKKCLKPPTRFSLQLQAAALEYLLFMIFVCTASDLGISIIEMPPAPALPVRTAVTNQSAYLGRCGWES